QWERLRGWLDEDGELGRVRARVASAAARWHLEGEPQDLLLAEGKPLLEAEELVAARAATLGELETRFVAGSRRRARAVRRLKRAAVAGLGALTVLAVVLGTVAWLARARATEMARLADDNRERAEANAATAAENERAANERAISLLVEQGRRELVAGEPERALPYLREARARGGSSVALGALVRDAVRDAETRLPVLRATGGPAPTPDGDPGAFAAVAWSPDGRTIASGARGGAVLLWDAASGAETRPCGGHDEAVTTVRFSPDGRSLLTASSDHTARLWRLSDCTLQATLGHESRLEHVSFAPDGARIVTVDGRGVVHVWDAASGGERLHFGGDAGTLHRARLLSDGGRLALGVADFDPKGKLTRAALELWTTEGERLWSAALEHAPEVLEVPPDGSLVAVGVAGTAELFATTDGSRTATLEAGARVAALAFSADGALLVAGGYGSEITAFRAGTDPKGVRRFTRAWSAEAHRDDARGATLTRARTYDLELDAAGETLLTSGSDGVARVWDATSGRRLATLTGHVGSVLRASHAPDGTRILTLGEDGAARLFRATRGRLRGIAQGQSLAPDDRERRLGPTGRRLAVLRRDGSVCAGGVGERELPAIGRATALAFAADDDTLVTGRDDGSLALQAWPGPTERGLAARHDAPVTAVAIAPTTGLVLSAARDRSVRLQYLDGRAAPALEALDRPASFVSLDPTARFAAAAGRGLARVWRVADGSVVLTDDRAHDDVALYPSVAWSPDGTLAVVATSGVELDLWDVAAGTFLRTLEAERVAWSPAGDKLVLTSSTGARARLVTARSGEVVAELDAQASGVSAAAFFPDGERFALAAVDGRILVFETRTAALLAAIEGHAGAVGALAFDPAGTELTSVADDGVRRWDVGLDLRPADELAALPSPFRLQQGRLVPVAPAVAAPAAP
ncbi:MAG: hypothetical protein HY908_30585, partial [Myxococcales bacterium]|nr:hypothetical protein [Myxococcales bacterium]